MLPLFTLFPVQDKKLKCIPLNTVDADAYTIHISVFTSYVSRLCFVCEIIFLPLAVEKWFLRLRYPSLRLQCVGPRSVWWGGLIRNKGSMLLPESDVYPLYLASSVGRLADWWTAAGSRSAPAPTILRREGLALCFCPPFFMPVMSHCR